MNFSLLQKIYWQAVMYFEQVASFQIDSNSANQIAKGLHTRTAQPFFEKLTFRAKYLDDDRQLQTAVATVAALFGKLFLVVCAVALLLGFLSVGFYLQDNAVGSGIKTINFYGILLGFLAANFLTLALWLLLLIFAATLSPSSWFMQISLKFLASKASNHAASMSGARAYIDYLLSRHGRWRLYALSHAAWALFFVGVIAALLFYFSIEGFQFNWHSTLLSDASLQKIASAITILPQQFGFELAGNDLNQAGQARNMALILLLSFALYGFLPRLFLAIICGAIALIAARKYLPDTTIPYYQNLAHVLDNQLADSTILDADNPELYQAKKPIKTSGETGAKTYRHKQQHLNQWLANNKDWHLLALDMPKLPISWQALDWQQATDLGLGANRAALATAMQQAIGVGNLLLVLRLASMPDRGLARVISEFKRACGTLGIALIYAEQYQNRLPAWLQLGSELELSPILLLDDDFNLLETK